MDILFRVELVGLLVVPSAGALELVDDLEASDPIRVSTPSAHGAECYSHRQPADWQQLCPTLAAFLVGITTPPRQQQQKITFSELRTTHPPSNSTPSVLV